MTRQLINSERLHRDVPYHHAAAATGATLVFTAGACPLDSDGRVVAAGDGTDGPPSTLVGVSVLGWPGQLVEIEAIAVRR